MALDQTLTDLLKNDDWYKTHAAAWEIVEKGGGVIASTKPANHNLQSLLANLCAYGSTRWSYAPGSTTKPDLVLAGTMTVTDCKSLAEMFLLLAQHLDAHMPAENKFGNPTLRKIEKDGYRIVTTPHLFAFNNRSGSPDLEGRWCFGDHYVVECQGLCYDPTFKVQSFSFNQPPHIAWYAKEDRMGADALKTKIRTAYIDTTGKNKPIFMKIPSGDYTFNVNDPTVKK